MSNVNQSLLKIAVSALAFFLGTSLRAQTAEPSTASAISVLASSIAQPLQQAGVKKIIFADLKGPAEEVHPVGRWLADQLASSCQKDFPGLEIILRSLNEDAVDVDGPKTPEERFRSLEDWARRNRANVFVKGTFARWSYGIGVSLSAWTSSDSPREIGQATGLIPISDEITALSPDALPSTKGGVPRAGLGGMGVPQCIYCPPPQFSGDARKAKVEGSVVLEATITTDGRAANIRIVKDPGKGLGMQAIEGVRKWRFKPANGPDGKLVAVICPIEVTFRLFK